MHIDQFADLGTWELQWNFKQNFNIFIQEKALQNDFCICWSFCLTLNMFNGKLSIISCCVKVCLMFDKFMNLNETINTLGPKQNGQHFADDIFKCMFLNKTAFIKSHQSLFLGIQLTRGQDFQILSYLIHSWSSDLAWELIISSISWACVEMPNVYLGSWLM